MRVILALSLLLPVVAAAETVVPAHTIRANTVIAATDLAISPATASGGLTDPAEIIGREARTTLYAGRAIRPEDIGRPAIVDRNQIVPLSYVAGGLHIMTEGRALARGGAGDIVRVMNLISRTTVSGRILPDGTVTTSLSP